MADIDLSDPANQSVWMRRDIADGKRVVRERRETERPVRRDPEVPDTSTPFPAGTTELLETLVTWAGSYRRWPEVEVLLHRSRLEMTAGQARAIYRQLGFRCKITDEGFVLRNVTVARVDGAWRTLTEAGLLPPRLPTPQDARYAELQRLTTLPWAKPSNT